jgi:hypothetical protein
MTNKQALEMTRFVEGLYFRGYGFWEAIVLLVRNQTLQ